MSAVGAGVGGLHFCHTCAICGLYECREYEHAGAGNHFDLLIMVKLFCGPDLDQNTVSSIVMTLQWVRDSSIL